MRFPFLALAVFLALTTTFAPAAAQHADVDIASVAAETAHHDSEETLARLENAPPAIELPGAFSEPTYIDPSTMTGSSGGIDEGTVSGIIGTAAYSLVYEPGGVPATPGAAPVASPQASGPVRLYSVASLHYVVFDHEISPDALTDLNSALKAAIGDEAAESEIHEVTVNDTTAYRFAMETTINDVTIYAEWLAIPVGNVAVVSMTMSGGEDVDLETLAADAEALALTGIAHLSGVLAAPQPAG